MRFAFVLTTVCAVMTACTTTDAPAPTGHPSGIREEAFVPIGGIDQWLTIRGDDQTKPVLLILHGGPGQAQSYLTERMKPLEHDFVVVNWDQRGAGRTLARAEGVVDPDTSLKTMVDDGLAVTDYVKTRLHRRKIILLGFSWGSRLGVEMAQARPAAFSAYVGTGQAADVQPATDAWVYGHLFEAAGAAHDAAVVDELRQVGPPPWEGAAAQRLYRAAAAYRGPDIGAGEVIKAATQAGWTAPEIQALVRGRSAYKGTWLEQDIAAFDPASFGARLTLPVIVIDGRDDLTTPPAFAEKWLARIPARKKVFRTIEHAGHQALLTHTAAFDRELVGALELLER